MMQSVPLEMDDIFGGEDVEDFNLSRLPDLEDELEPMRDEVERGMDAEDGQTNEVTDDPEILAKLKSMRGASKNGTKRSMPKLDADRITGERGIPILPKLFEKVSLKGRNHEAEDLKRIMQHLEHWGHRLFPKMPFAELLDRAERLGAKRAVQTCVKKIRLDMPVLADDHVGGDDDDDVQRMGVANTEVFNGNVVEDRERDSASPFPDIDEDELEDLIRDQEEVSQTSATVRNSSGTPAEPEKVAKDSSVSDEMRERMERNKRLAMEKRAAKMAQQQKTGSEGSKTHPHTPEDDFPSQDEGEEEGVVIGKENVPAPAIQEKNGVESDSPSEKDDCDDRDKGDSSPQR